MPPLLALKDRSDVSTAPVLLWIFTLVLAEIVILAVNVISLTTLMSVSLAIALERAENVDTMVMVGTGVGISDGDDVGSRVGEAVGSGVLVGCRLGASVGSGMGKAVGAPEGSRLGTGDGSDVGTLVGAGEGGPKTSPCAVWKTSTIGAHPENAASLDVSSNSKQMSVLPSSTIVWTLSSMQK